MAKHSFIGWPLSEKRNLLQSATERSVALCRTIEPAEVLSKLKPVRKIRKISSALTTQMVDGYVDPGVTTYAIRIAGAQKYVLCINLEAVKNHYRVGMRSVLLCKVDIISVANSELWSCCRGNDGTMDYKISDRRLSCCQLMYDILIRPLQL
jgi:hypothetical protein